MKKMILSPVLLVLILGVLTAQSITVTDPNAGETVFKGLACKIRWTSRDVRDAKIKIQLYDAAAANKIKLIARNLTNNRRFDTPEDIFNNVAPGRYTIKVKAQGINVEGFSAVFNLIDPAGSTINVTKPARDENWVKSGEHTIEWTKTGNQPELVMISLYDEAGTREITRLEPDTANDGSYTCNSRRLQPIPAGKYRIQVTTRNNLVTGLSQVFNLKEFAVALPLLQFSTSSIKVVHPNRDRPLTIGSDCRIGWQGNNITNNIHIALYRRGEFVGVIEKNLDKDRISHYWTVGELRAGGPVIPGSGYKIRVLEHSTGIFDESDVSFSINAAGSTDETASVRRPLEYDLQVDVKKSRFSKRKIQLGTSRDHAYYRLKLTIKFRNVSRHPSGAPVTARNVKGKWKIKNRFGTYASGEFSLSTVGPDWRKKRVLNKKIISRENNWQDHELIVILDPYNEFNDINLNNNKGSFIFRFTE